MNVPDDRGYTEEHEWVQIAGNRARVGITDYAQDALGDVVFVQLPDVGSQAEAGESFGEVESTKSVSDVYAPVTGLVVEVNLTLNSEPEKINSDPYGEGWICIIEMSEPEGTVLSAEDYRKLTSA